MRINKFVALATGLSRRSVDQAIIRGRVQINSKTASLGEQVNNPDKVYLDHQLIIAPIKKTVILLNKPPGYVSSRIGQGSKTIYDLIPSKYQNLKPVGRLDKESSGLLVLTDDGDLAYSLSHPKFAKDKVYITTLDRRLEPKHKDKINKSQVVLDGRPSNMRLKNLKNEKIFEISLSEGRNRQIRRSFEVLGYRVVKLERISFGPYKLTDLEKKLWIELDN